MRVTQEEPHCSVAAPADGPAATSTPPANANAARPTKSLLLTRSMVLLRGKKKGGYKAEANLLGSMRP
jgi:hypothetical protein